MALLVLLVAAKGNAQQTAEASAPVARLSYLSGPVQVQMQNGTDQAADAALNMPLPQGERVSTGENGEAEIEFADGSVLRLTPNSTAALEKLGPATDIDVTDGLFYLELRSSDRIRYTVNAVEQSIAPQENASFRIRVASGQMETGVLKGAVSITRANAYSAELEAGESLRSDPKNAKRYFLSATLPEESWDNWNEKLSQKAQDEAALRTGARDAYAGDQGYGWADLDANGTWYSVPGEGTIWQPASIDAGFDPYGYGSWSYGPGGYTWASGYSWGWLPYRCGRWSYYAGFGWGWLPAAGCVNYGGGFGGAGGFPVRNPPNGWRPPHPPSGNGAGEKAHHPTLPVHPLTDAFTTGLAPRRSSQPGASVRIGGVTGTVFQPLSNGYTPQGQSAVGSALLRDFPVRVGTQEPVLGRQSQRPVAIPGRPADWHHVDAAGSSPVPQGRREQLQQREGLVTYGVHPAPADSAVTVVPPRTAKPSDPPFNANGTPPVNATGAPPLNATGIPGVAPPAGLTSGPTRVGTPQPTMQLPPTRVSPPLPPRQVEAQPVNRPPVVQSAPAMPRMVAPVPPAPPQPRSAPAPSAPRSGPSNR